MKSRSHHLPTISDTPDDWVDGSWTVDCVCGVNFDDGEEMVDCDECGVWVHTRCSRYVKSEKLFACDKCKIKKLRKESEETEVAQLLVELPTKTVRMDNPYPLSCPNPNPFHVWTEVPMEEKVHVQGIPGGDPALFKGASSVFNSELWKYTGYVPKKFDHQYREFPCWDNRQNDNNIDNDKIKEENDSNGADALFLLSKENGGIKTEVNGSGELDMGPPNNDSKVENNENRQKQSDVKKSQKKDDSNTKKNAKFMEKDGESKKRNHHSSDSVVATTSSDAKQSESNEGKTDKESGKHENSTKGVDKSENCNDTNPLDNNISFDDSKIKEIEENKDTSSPKKEDDMASALASSSSSSVVQNHTETSPMKQEADHEVDDSARSKNNDKIESTPNGKNHAPVEPKSVEVNPICNIQNDKTSSASVELKKEAVYVSQKVNKSPPQIDTKPDKSPCGTTQPKLYVKRSDTSRSSLKTNLTCGVPKIIVKKSSVPDKSRYSNTDNKIKTNGNKNNNNSINGDISERSVKDMPRSSSTSALKSSHVLKKNSSDLKESAILSSSKTSSAALESGDSANSSGSENRAHESNIKNSEKINRQHVPKNHLPHVHPTPSPATLSDEELALLLHQELNSSPRVPRVPRMRQAGSLPSGTSTSTLMKRTSTSAVKDNNVSVPRKKNKESANNNNNCREFDGLKKVVSVSYSRRSNDNAKNGSVKTVVIAPTVSTSGPSSSNDDDETGPTTHRTLPGLIAEIMSKGKRMSYEDLCNAVLPHWPNLRKHNGERYAYSSHSQAVLDCLRNRSEWSRLVDRGPKTNAGRKRRKSETDAPNVESEEEEEDDDDDYSTDRNTKGKIKERKQRRLALQGRGIKDVRRRRKAEVVSDEDEDDDDSSSSDSSEESDEERKASGPNEASASSDEMET